MAANWRYCSYRIRRDSLVSVRASSCRTVAGRYCALRSTPSSTSPRLGGDYRARGRVVPGIVDELKIKIYNSSGADFATLNSHEFNVSCVLNQVQLIAGNDPRHAEGANLLGLGLRSANDHRTSFSNSAPALLLAAGDTVTIGFEQPIDVDRLEAYRADNGLSRRAYVDTLFRLSSGALGANYTGTWLNALSLPTDGCRAAGCVRQHGDRQWRLLDRLPARRADLPEPSQRLVPR